jgi:hypothetical protein
MRRLGAAGMSRPWKSMWCLHTHKQTLRTTYTTCTHALPTPQQPTPRPQVAIDDDDEDDSKAQVEEDEEDEEADDDEDEDEDEEENKTKKKESTKNNPHCNINFVTDTVYPFLAADYITKTWGKGTLTDPSPAVPSSRADSVEAGDYVLVTGHDVTLLTTSRTSCVATFVPEEELILQNDWSQFDDEMSGQDLRDLGDLTFLLWWQNVKAPKVKAAANPRKPKAKAPAKKKTKR